MHQKKRNEDRRNTDRDEPCIAHVAGRMKRQAFCRKLIVELPYEWFERSALKPQAERGDPVFKKFLVAQGCPIGSFHLAQATTEKSAVTLSPWRPPARGGHERIRPPHPTCRSMSS